MSDGGIEMIRNASRKLAWCGLATVVVAAMLVPAALADKPPSKAKPIASGKSWVKVGGGKGLGTYVVFNGALGGLGIVPTPLRPATTDAGVRFPITQGKLVLGKTGNPLVVTGLLGTVGHVGGLSLKKGDVTVRVRNLIVVANVAGAADTSMLTAQVNGKRIDLASLKLTMPPTISGTTVTVGVTDIKLTATAAKALSQAFFANDTSVPADTPIGTATLKARLVGHGHGQG